MNPEKLTTAIMASERFLEKARAVRETTAIVRAEERKAIAKWLMSRRTGSENQRETIDIHMQHIEALARGETPDGWPEKGK